MDVASMNSLDSGCLWTVVRDKKVLGPVSTLLQEETDLPSQALASSLLSPTPCAKQSYYDLGNLPSKYQEAGACLQGTRLGSPGKCREAGAVGVATAPSTWFSRSTPQPPNIPSHTGLRETSVDLGMIA